MEPFAQLRTIALLLGCAAVAGGCAAASAGEREAPPTPRGPVPTVERALTVRDDFANGDDPLRSGWSGDPGWRVHGDGALYPPADGGALRIGPDTWRDEAVRVRLRSAGDDRPLAVRLRVGRDGEYRLTWQPGPGAVELDRIEGDTHRTLATAHVDAGSSDAAVLDAQAVGDRLTAAVDGRPVLDVLDEHALPAGAVGVAAGAGAGPGAFDDVRIRATVDDFTVAVLPDTQYYTPHAAPATSTFTAQTTWLAQHRATDGIAVALHTGDVVDDVCAAAQWRVASFAMRRLDGKLPYAIAPGNRDTIAYEDACAGEAGYVARRHTVDTRSFNRRGNFPAARQRAAAPETWGGTMRPGDASESVHRVDAGGVPLTILTLPFGPDAAALRWARGVARRDADRVGILVTHDYLAADGRLRGDPRTQSTLASLPGQLEGREIWRRLVAPAPDLRLVLSGHVEQCQVREPRACRVTGVVGRSARRNDAGRDVHALLADFQNRPDGGGGYLRLLRVIPARHRIEVRTYSPTLHRYLTDPRNQFTLTGVDLR
ncbi:MAG: metallophosphoesterase [Thermoleophilia bacterium]|nr:metallophosphoesterase [Thermoleophilia bacterium]